MANINRVTLTGNLTKDPELRALGSGTSVCSLRLAVNTRRRGADGTWEDKPNYFDITIWGNQGENAARYLAKGRPVAVDGRLEWREWTDQAGNKRQSVEVVADNVQFLGSRDENGGGGGGGYGGGSGGGFTPRSDVPVDTGDFAPAGANGSSAPAADDDIPF